MHFKTALVNKKGFTLLELLVVMSVIGILLGISTISYATAQVRARDARRKGDLKYLQDAAEQYFSVCGFTYPYTTGTIPTAVFCTDPSVAVAPTVPMDPNATGYICTTCSSSAYRICVTLEQGASSYCVQSQQ
ncbi:MAG: type II secretion system GspH family protein [Candidatus Roizmanbacteria bacterium]|nr:type II secretion system GspH family protein [Candidatus Roizmanbacteria bacterium]